MKAREGDLVESKDGLVFDVKGFVQPPGKTVAFPRFLLDPFGKRKSKAAVYKKIYAISDRYNFLKAHLPHYLVFDPVFGVLLSEVPDEDVRQHYKPAQYLQELRGRETKELTVVENNALSFLQSLKENANVPWDALGISGSLLAHLALPESDIDPLVSGRKYGEKVYEALTSMMKDRNNPTRPYSKKELRKLYSFRSQDTEMLFEDFLEVERRKILQGSFLQSDFYIRCIKDWNEIKEQYGDVIYQSVGQARIRAVITNDSEAIFTPCRYLLDQVSFLQGCVHAKVDALSEISSFRGRFCEQAEKGETVIAQGKVEKVSRRDGSTSFRLMIGTKTSDFMVKR
ncbi:MAG: hypothetical protein NWE78_04685 [Candidatus Bathyarchaeota archaeon]|nr:hypothetical protein [Candidatus Bathyarchaeota archaeon]